MKKARFVVVMAVLAAFMVVVLAPAAFASAGVTMHLTGPHNADYGSWVPLKLTVKNPLKADGNRVALCFKSRDGGLYRLVSKQIVWNSSETRGWCTFMVKAAPSAMGIGIYKASWMHPGGTSYSNHVRSNID